MGYSVWAWRSVVTKRSSKRLRPGQCPIDDEVQTIVLRTLAKERERRYQSAGELAKDIGHYLAGEPIEAKRDSGWYVLKKQLRRYKIPVAVAAVFVLLLGGSTIVLSLMYQNQSRARTAEAEQRRLAEKRAAEFYKFRQKARAGNLARHQQKTLSEWEPIFERIRIEQERREKGRKKREQEKKAAEQ